MKKNCYYQHHSCFVSPISFSTSKAKVLPFSSQFISPQHLSSSSSSALLPSTSTRSVFRASLSPTHGSNEYANNNNVSKQSQQQQQQRLNNFVKPSFEIWNGLRKVIRISAISATLLLSPTFQQQQQQQQQRYQHTLNNNLITMVDNNNNPNISSSLFKSKIFNSSSSKVHAAAFASTKTSTTNNHHETSDVEAAAMTLGAVTLGGLFMRLIINRSRNSELEKKKLADECERLQKEEHIRSLRIQRSELEKNSISEYTKPSSSTSENTSYDEEQEEEDDFSQLQKQIREHQEKEKQASIESLQQVEIPSNDSDLMSDLKKRMESMDQNNNNDNDNDNDSDNDNNKNNMRHNPIPDRGTGSAVLERPSSSDDSTNDSNSNGNENEDDSPAKQEELDMLKRMWNLSSPDKEKE